MKLATLLVMCVLPGVAAQMRSPTPASRAVIACVDLDADTTVRQAKGVTVKLFQRVGVELQWRGLKFCPVGNEENILIRLKTDTPVHLVPGAMAIASPEGGIHVEVFYDRVRKSIQPEGVVSLLGHVFAHEIGHLLQGTGLHSEDGLMKARWTSADYARMMQDLVTFSDADAALIRRRLDLQALSPGRAVQTFIRPSRK